MAPVSAFGAMGVFVLVIATTRYVSLGSLAGAGIGMAIVGVLWALDIAFVQYFIYTAVAVALIIFQHRDNVSRLLSGNENRVGQSGEKRQDQ